MSLSLTLSQRPRPPPRHRRATASIPTPSTRVKAPRTRRPRLDPEDVVVEGRVGAELRLLEAEGLAPGRLLRLVYCCLRFLRRWRVSLSPRRCAFVGSAVGLAAGSEVGSAAGSEVGSAAAAAPKVTRRGLARAGANEVGAYAIAATHKYGTLVKEPGSTAGSRSTFLWADQKTAGTRGGTWPRGPCALINI